jgi:nitroreductase
MKYTLPCRHLTVLSRQTEKEAPMTTVTQAIKARISANNFDTSHVMTNAEISALVELAGQAPTSFNQQNWRAIAVTSAEGKAKLMGLAYGQAKVAAAAVTFIMVGKTTGYKDLPAMFASTVAAGHMPQETLDGMVGMATGMYGSNPTLQRDEAVRSASMAGMTLMLAAEEKGLVTGPMIGFDPAGVSAAFGLAADEVPAMVIACGNAAPGNWPRKARRPVAETVTFA